MGNALKTQWSPQQFGQLRARIEATFSEAAVIVITSGARRDGKSVTAMGLSQSFANAGHRVLFVDTNVESPTLARIHRIANVGTRIDLSAISRAAKPVAGERFLGVSLADERFEFGVSLDQVRAAVYDMRSHFEFVVVDTATLVNSDLAALFSTVADGVFLTLRVGRLATDADGQTIKTLGRLEANVLGAVTVSEKLIANFAQQREEVLPTMRYSARHVTTQHVLEPEVRELVEPSRSNAVS
jgi:Mrp family chromosome partitioning ATPase